MTTWAETVAVALDRLCATLGSTPEEWVAHFDGGWAEAGPALARKVARRRGGIGLPAEVASPFDRLVAAVERTSGGRHEPQVVSGSDMEVLRQASRDPGWMARLVSAIGTVEPGGQMIARRYTDRQLRLVRAILDAGQDPNEGGYEVVSADVLAGPDPVVLTVSRSEADWVIDRRPLTAAEHRVARFLRHGPATAAEAPDLWAEASRVGVDLDLWIAARAAVPEDLAVGEIVELLAVRRGWTPLPVSLVDAVGAVMEDARAAVAHRQPAADPTVELLGRLATIPGIWSQLQGGMLLGPDGVSFPFPAGDVELLRTLARLGGDGAAAADALGPLAAIRLKAAAGAGGAS